jgi:aromatase
MHLTTHSIQIDGSVEATYDVIARPERWPELFPPCRSVTLLNDSSNEQRFEITALANGTERTWTSRRVLDPKNHAIDFASTKPLSLLSSMSGRWHATALDEGTLLSLDHEFDLTDQIPPEFAHLANRTSALDFMHRTLDTNSWQELAAIKEVVEQAALGPSATKKVFFEAMTIAADADQALAVLQNATGGPAVLPHSRNVSVGYDDGANQEFEMTVDTPHGVEVIRSIRHCSRGAIRYFQPKPPPVLARHSGAWYARPLRHGCRLESWHTVELDLAGVERVWGDVESDEALERVRNAINNNSKGTMNAIAKRLEQGEASVVAA